MPDAGTGGLVEDAFVTTGEGPTEHDGASVIELIALGRDREAVDAATRQLGAQRVTDNLGDFVTGGGAMDGVQQLDQIIPLLESLVAEIAPQQLTASTPCANFTVSGVLEHMIAGATAFAPAFRGEPSPVEPVQVEGTTPQRWRHAMEQLATAIHTSGAQDRTIASPLGDVSGATFARYVAFDGLIHGWDLAVATGQRYAPPEDLVAEVDAFARGFLQPAMRDGDTFAEETHPPATTSPLERLVAFSGRSIPTGEEQQ
jgi:uncharacterized protein (TIGR03086 family)